MDFIFGTLATDDLKLVHHRAGRRGVQHRHALAPRSPAPGDAVTLSLLTGGDLDITQAACYYTTDGSLPAGSRGTATNGTALPLTRVETTWDTLEWRYLTRWQVTLPPQPEGTFVRYRLGAWGAAATDEVFADTPEVKRAAEEAAVAFFRGQSLPENIGVHGSAGKTFSYHVNRYQPPVWAREAVIYQVFIDRFYPGDGRAWLATDEPEGVRGGTLWGVADKLDYLADLGITCLWLSPTCVSPTAHGYDVTDYYRVEPRLGGDDALRALVAAAHARGIRVLLDLVCNHMSDQHPFFQEALNNPASPYREWFLFDDSDIGYRSFFGVPSMPQINVGYDAARDYLLDVARYWLREFGIDGFRLDHADGPGADFWAFFRAACREINPESYVFGEIVDSPEVLAEYIGRLDGCLDFLAEDALRRTYGWGNWSTADFARFVDSHYSYFPPEQFLMPTFLDNHDMDRFLYIVKGDKAALKRAAEAQFRLPGPPVIYYGTEVGLSQPTSMVAGGGLHVSRVPMPWDEAQDADLLAFYKRLIRARRGGH